MRSLAEMKKNGQQANDQDRENKFLTNQAHRLTW